MELPAQPEHVREAVARHRTGVGVRTAQRDLPPLEAVLLLQLIAEPKREPPVDADHVQRHEDRARSLGILKDERLGPEVVDLGARRARTAGIARHPHRLLRRDVHPGDAGLPRCRARCLRECRAHEEQHRRDSRCVRQLTPFIRRCAFHLATSPRERVRSIEGPRAPAP